MPSMCMIACRFRRRAVGKLIQRRRDRHASGDAQHFVEIQFLHIVLLGRRCPDPAGLARAPTGEADLRNAHAAAQC